MEQQSTILQDLISGYLTSPSFLGFIQSPPVPIEADKVFAFDQNLAPYDSRIAYTISRISNAQNIAGEVARRGEATSIIVGQNNTTNLSFPIAKIAKTLCITNEMLDQFMRVESILQAKPNATNIGLFLEKTSCSPVLLLNAINQGIEQIVWFGSHVASVLAKNGTATTDDYKANATIPGVFKNPSITSVSASSTGTGTGSDRTLWINKNLQQIINDLVAISNSIENTIYRKPDTLALSMTTHNYLQQTPVNATYNVHVSLKDAIEKALPDLNIIGCYAMNDLSSKYDDNLGDRAIMLCRNKDYSVVTTSARGVMSAHRPAADCICYNMHAYLTGLAILQSSSIKIITNIG